MVDYEFQDYEEYFFNEIHNPNYYPNAPKEGWSLLLHRFRSVAFIADWSLLIIATLILSLCFYSILKKAVRWLSKFLHCLVYSIRVCLGSKSVNLILNLKINIRIAFFKNLFVGERFFQMPCWILSSILLRYELLKIPGEMQIDNERIKYQPDLEELKLINEIRYFIELEK
ncbi:hypothetical protein SSS_08705 [Sarcoptes scabiei]|nr:hypothetical protein SSS_08705 [Sarcoptes scabiei]